LAMRVTACPNHFRVQDLSLSAHESEQINKSHRTSLIRFSNSIPIFRDAEDTNPLLQFKGPK